MKKEKILVIRMLGLGDVACIGVPAARRIRRRHPDAEIAFLTLGAGAELLELVPEIDLVLRIDQPDWPDSVAPAINSFAGIAQRLGTLRFDVVYNLDTWFMPCVLGTMLEELGMELRGNRTTWSLRELVTSIKAGDMTQREVLDPSLYMVSTFPGMDAWSTRWWESEPDAGPHGRFYLERCCGFNDPSEVGQDEWIDVEEDEELRADRPVLALALTSRTGARDYPHAGELVQAFQDKGYQVWSGFGASHPIVTTLARLKASDLTVTVSSAAQWLARAVGCPTLVIPGPVPLETLCPDATIEPHCDHMDVPVERVVAASERFLTTIAPTRRRPRSTRVPRPPIATALVGRARSI